MRRGLVLLLAGGLGVLFFIVARSSAGTDKRSQTKAAVVRTSQPPAAMPLASGWRYRPNGRRGWRSVAIPNDFNPTVSRRGDRGSVGWYRLEFTGPPQYSGRTWSIHFESVRRNATVWLNGRQIGQNADPYAPFSLPATSLAPDARNTLLVRVDNRKPPGSLPEDWWNWGGIMGPVELEPVGRLSLRDLAVLPELGCGYRCGNLVVQGSLINRLAGPLQPTVVVQVTSPDGGVSETRRVLDPVRGGGSAEVSFRVPVDHPDLWSPGHPALYGVSVQVEAAGRTEDSHYLHAGMRSVHVHGGTLYLNGRRLWLHGAAIHEDMSGQGAALSDGDIDTLVSELRSAGVNVTRAHYLLSDRLLDALDAAGILVWEQAPVDHADQVLSTAPGRARALALLRSTLVNDRSHPSVIINSVGNELSPNPSATPGTLTYLREAIPLARAGDPAAAVALDTYCYPGYARQPIYSALDILGISSYFGWYTGPPDHSVARFGQLRPFLEQAHTRYPRQAVVVSEYGAEGVYDGPADVKGTYAFQTRYMQRTLSVLDSLRFMNGAIYWTLREFAVAPGWRGGVQLPLGLDPDGVHHKGFIAYDGTPKPGFARAEQLLGQTPAFAR